MPTFNPSLLLVQPQPVTLKGQVIISSDYIENCHSPHPTVGTAEYEAWVLYEPESLNTRKQQAVNKLHH